MQSHFTTRGIYIPPLFSLFYIPHAGISAKSQLDSSQPVSDMDGEEGHFVSISHGMTSCQSNKCPTPRRPQRDGIHAGEPRLQTITVLALELEPRNGAG